MRLLKQAFGSSYVPPPRDTSGHKPVLLPILLAGIGGLALIIGSIVAWRLYQNKKIQKRKAVLEVRSEVVRTKSDRKRRFSYVEYPFLSSTQKKRRFSTGSIRTLVRDFTFNRDTSLAATNPQTGLTPIQQTNLEAVMGKPPLSVISETAEAAQEPIEESSKVLV